MDDPQYLSGMGETTPLSTPNIAIRHAVPALRDPLPILLNAPLWVIGAKHRTVA